MLDAPVRRLIDPSLARIGGTFARMGISANGLTIAGFVVGLGAVVAIAMSAYWAGLALIVLNRLFDGLDGAVARVHGATDLGAYLDIVLDFIVYAAVPFGFAIADPSRALAAAFLILAFVGTGTTFLGYAVFAAKRGITTDLRGSKSFYYLGGLTEGTETIVVFVLACLFPAWFSVICYVFGVMCFVTMGTRIAAAVSRFGAS